MPKATNLAQVLNFFDPRLTLRTPEELAEWYVSRADSPLEPMAVRLQTAKTSQKLLFTGHLGCGKSTELAKLAGLVQDQFFVVAFSMLDITGITDIHYADVVMGLAFEIFRQATEKKVEVNKQLLDQIYAWFDQVVGETRESREVVEIGAKLNLAIVSLEPKYRNEFTIREDVRLRSQGRLDELRELLDHFVVDVEKKVKRRVLAVVEGLDKIPLQAAHDIFYLHGPALTAPGCSIIYTFPIALRHHQDFEAMGHYYTGIFNPLPNFPTHHRDGSPDSGGRTALERIVTNRAELPLFTADALERLVLSCGGLPFEMARLIQSASTYAMVRKASQIDRATVDRAVLERRIHYQGLLSPDQLQLLAQVHRTKAITNDAAHRALLHNLSALEYRNGQGVWYDVHPIVQSLLPKDAAP